MAEEAILLQEYCARNVRVRRAFAPRFLKAFGTPLDKRFWDNLLGFDVVKFDDVVVKSGSRSMYEVVVFRFGQEAADLLKELLAAEGTVIEEPAGK
jgi:hypothetical protein